MKRALSRRDKPRAATCKKAVVRWRHELLLAQPADLLGASPTRSAPAPAPSGASSDDNPAASTALVRAAAERTRRDA